MDLEHSTLLIQTISISPNDMFFSVGYSSGEIHIYSLFSEEYLNKKEKGKSLKEKLKQATCDCLQEFEENLNKDKKTTGFFGKLLKLKDVFFEKPKKQPFSTLVFENSEHEYSSFFIKKNELMLITDTQAQKFKFSSVEGGRGWCYKKLTYNNNPLQLERVESGELDSDLTNYKDSFKDEDYI